MSFSVLECVKEGIWDLFYMLLNHPKLYDFKERDEFGNTVLHYIILREKNELIQIVLDIGLNVNAVNNFGETPLKFAIKKNNKEICESLISKGADVNLGDKKGETPIFHAVKTGKLKLMKLLMNHGALIDLINKEGENLLHFAVKYDFYDIVEFLLKQEKNLDVNFKNKSGDFVLKYAVINRNMGMVSLLIEHNAKIDLVDAKGRSLIHILVLENNKRFLKLFGGIISIDSRDFEGRTPLHLSIEIGFENLIQPLLINKANINTQDTDGYTPLHTSFQTQNKNIIKTILDHRPNINITNHNGDTVLHTAVSCKNLICIKLLTKICDVDFINKKNKLGQTALHYAGELKETSIFQHLIECKADEYSKDIFNKIPLDYMK